MAVKRFLLEIVVLTLIARCDFYARNNIRAICPHIYIQTFHGYLPRGNLTAGVYKEIKDTPTLKECVLKCCKTDCNVVFMNDEKCFHIRCNSNDLCIPTLSLNPDKMPHYTMVLVKPTDEESWEDVLTPKQFANERVYNVLSGSRRLEDIYKDLINDETYTNNYDLSCTVGAYETCLPNEDCIPNHLKSRTGTCTCKDDFERNSQGDCVARLQSGLLTERILNKSESVTRKPLIVSVDNKQVKLPNDDVTLIANVSPDDENIQEKYQFEFTSLQQPVGGGTAVKHQNGGQLHLSKLAEGLYTFKVSVSNSFSYGETFVNVTVLPPSRINQPPQIVITPANQTIKQPNVAAVLDASSSFDDDGIVAWHWELQQGPLGYQPELKDSSTLQLNDLTKPGNYTFKLTVTDTDKVTSSAVANITVLKFTDYPPDANAGEDKIIYLPHNKITLNGNLSTDDHAITTWEWTKGADDAQKAVDMQNTRTPYLKLSNLEEGMYTFVLKVTDSANQTSSAQVHVFVKPPTNRPPIANAGRNQTISLPQTWILLDASNSTDDNKIVAFKWEQIEGPSKVNFDPGNNSTKTNVTGLTKGNYIFKISVTDDSNNVASDNIYVVVNQNVNEKPKANAGGDFEIELPRNAIMVNGLKSSDDWAILKWKWQRNDGSMAVGNIGENSDESPILILTNCIPGKYSFNLTVYDEQGLTDTDMVNFIVKNDPKLIYLIDMIVDIDAVLLNQLQYNKLIGKLALLVMDGAKLQIRDVKPDIGSGKAKLTFYVESGIGQPYPANDIVRHLREKLRVDASLLGFTIQKLQTTICQNNCSGHGVCIEENRQCKCEAFWMNNLFKLYFANNMDSDCSWSILYVVLGGICCFVLLISVLWMLIYLCYTWMNKRKITKSATTTTYKLIEDTDDLPPFSTGRNKSNLSDSDTDSDVVFESRNKSGRFGNESRNGHHKIKNGYGKMGRRVKT